MARYVSEECYFFFFLFCFLALRLIYRTPISYVLESKHSFGRYLICFIYEILS